MNQREREHVHKMSTLNLWFGIGSLLFLVATVWLILADYSREWKQHQREFRTLEIQQTEEAIAQAAEAIDPEAVAALEKKLETGRAEIAARQAEVDKLQRRITRLDGEAYKANQVYQIEKSIYDAKKYETEEAIAHGDSGAAELRRKLARLEDEVTALKNKLDGSTKKRDLANTELKGHMAVRDEAQRGLDELMRDGRRLRSKLAGIEHNFINDVFRDLPMLDFIDPTLEVKQVVLADVWFDVNFLAVKAVDRCHSCHLAIDKPGFEDEQQPFRSHPRLDLYVGSSSPHPIEKHGCTSCHQGHGRSLSFLNAEHTPRDAEQEREWREKYDWKPPHYWDYPMFPLQYTEASCWKCHHNEVAVPQASKLNRGLELFERMGCLGCHKNTFFKETRKAGPDLVAIATKTHPAWVKKWIKAPSAFRPDTRMPHFFDLENTSQPHEVDMNDAEIAAMTTYLFEHSAKSAPESVPIGGGDPARGEELVRTVGCLACHVLEEEIEQYDRASPRKHGPSLVGLGEKTSYEWLYRWLKDPAAYFPETKMPDMRLTDEEARDIASYLTTLKAPASFEKVAKPTAKSGVVDELLTSYLSARYSASDVADTLGVWTASEKVMRLGEEAIRRYGCAGCHVIGGFEGAQPIGTELTEEGNKLTKQLDFGFVDLPETKWDWFYHKLRHPRSFDAGKVKARQEQLRMPDFRFSEEDAQSLTLALLSFTSDRVGKGAAPVPPTSIRDLGPAEPAIETSRWLVRNWNCKGCHMIEGEGGAIRDTIEDPGFWPPVLSGEGHKVQSEWLYHFLKEPTPIRPWLRARMPTFNLPDDHARKLTHYFAALDDQPFPDFAPHEREPDPELVQVGGEIVEMFRCAQCHPVGDVGAAAAALGASNLAPDLRMAKHRLRPMWIDEWMLDPQKLQEGTNMPTFFYEGESPLPDVLGGDTGLQIAAIREYLLTLRQ